MDDGAGGARGRLAERLIVGLLQGLALAAIIQIERRQPLAAANRTSLVVAILLASFVPVILLAGVGRLRQRTLLVWTASSSALLVGLGLYDVWRQPMPSAQPFPSLALFGFAGLAIYVVHHLIEPADVERRWRASYGLRFETAWRHAFQLAVAGAFTGVVSLVLTLASALFGMIGVGIFVRILRNAWFLAPALTLAFAAAVHQTDVRPSLIQGVRTIVLTLLAWLTPLLGGLVIVFLIAIPFAGIEKLWATKFASSLLLAAAGVMIVFLNAAYQDGRRDQPPPPPALRLSARVGAWLLVPLVSLALWAAGLRVAEHGLTPQRVVGIAIAVVEVVYAVGYAWAALAAGPWLRGIETVNVAAAVLTVALILAMLTPIADPARLSVDDQLHRLARGVTRPDRFDYTFLRFDAGRFGVEALARLTRSHDTQVAQLARSAQRLSWRFEVPASAGPRFVAYPAGSPMPAGLVNDLAQQPDLAECAAPAATCDVDLIAATAGQASMILVSTRISLILERQDAHGHWAKVGAYSDSACPGVEAALRKGRVETAAPAAPNLQAAGQTLDFIAQPGCIAPPPRESPSAAARGKIASSR